VKRLFTVIFALISIGHLATPIKAEAYGDLVDCVVVRSAGLSPFPYFGSLAYEVKVQNGCDADIGTIKLEFDSGSFDVFSFGSESIYNLGSYGKTVQFQLENIKPGYYSPSVKITSREDYSYKRVRLPAYTINAPNQPSLGNDGGSATLENRRACTTSPGFVTTCMEFPNWSFDMCSSLKSGTLQEFVGSEWKTLWKVTGVLDTDSCTEKIPYFVELSGETSLKLGKSSKMRMVFKGTKMQSGFTRAFTISVKKK